MPAAAKPARPIAHALPRVPAPETPSLVISGGRLSCRFCEGTGYDWANYDEEQDEEPPICERCLGTGRAR